MCAFIEVIVNRACMIAGVDYRMWNCSWLYEDKCLWHFYGGLTSPHPLETWTKWIKYMTGKRCRTTIKCFRLQLCYLPITFICIRFNGEQSGHGRPWSRECRWSRESDKVRTLQIIFKRKRKILFSSDCGDYFVVLKSKNPKIGIRS